MSLSNLSLDAFLAIAEAGTIVLAAQRLGVTQTALTQRIKVLEAELEVPLFLRSRRGMALTSEGQHLLDYCRLRRQQEEEAILRVKGLAVELPQRLRISGPTLQTQSRFFAILPRLREEFPRLYLSFDINDSEDPVLRLRRGEADLVLMSSRPDPSLGQKRLSPSEFLLVGPQRWRGRELREIIATESIVDFAAGDEYTIRYLERHRILPRHLPERHFINNTHQMLQLVEEGLGYGVFDERHVREKLAQKKLVNLAPHLKSKADWWLAWMPSGDRVGSALKALIDLTE